MASTNGVLSPPPQPDLNHGSISPSIKRKRDESIEQPDLTNGISNESKITITKATPTEDQDHQERIRDLIDVLKSYDPSPSILTRPLPERLPSAEPQAKRQKPDGATDLPSILSRSSANEYNTLDDVLKDIDAAVSDITERLQLSPAANRNQYIPVSSNQSELSMKISAFKKRAYELVRREKALMDQGTNTSVNQTLNVGGYTANRKLGVTANDPINAGPGDSKMVLTLYGNAPQAKYLFSSLQVPSDIDGQRVVQPLREAGLPNGITTTQIVPIQSAGLDDERKSSKTLGELYPTPSNILPLKPPKILKTTPSSTDGWYQPSISETAARSASYSKQPITTGQWLDYSNLSTINAEKKREKAARANAKPDLSNANSTEIDAAELDALFRSAYSGFAPTKDDSKAIAPEGAMNKLWWQYIGEERFGHLIENASDRRDNSPNQASESHVSPADDVEMEEFEQVVKEWSNDSIDPSLTSLDPIKDKSAQEKDVEEVLEGISELLETLESFQRNRMSLNTPARAAGVHVGAEPKSIGTPSMPSESETATYEIIKSQLVLMISMLPPYAVAKLNSDQLSELSISTKIEVPIADYKGVMDEDEVAMRARVAALSAAAATTARPTTSSSLHRSTSSAALYGNQYSTSRPAASTGHQYYGASQTPIRPPMSNLQRPPATAPAPISYPPQRAPTAAPYRPAAYSGVAYPHQARTPGPVIPQYAQSNGQQYHQTPTNPSYGRSQSQSYQTVPQSTPQSALPTRYPSQPQYSAQPQPIQNGTNYSYSNGVHVGRQGSPQKPTYSQQNHAAQTPIRPPYSTPTPPIGQDRRYMQGPLAQPPVMNGASQSPQTQPPSLPQQAHQQQLGPTNYSTFMTTEQQTSMMERQRAQLAQQQGTQHQARSAAQAGAMGSPQPQINSGSAVAAGS